MALPHEVDSMYVDNAGISVTGAEARPIEAGTWVGDGVQTALGGIVRHGNNSLAVTINASDVITVQPGAVVIPGNYTTGTGVYRSALTAAITGSPTARDATNARIDLVVFRQYDTNVVGAHGSYRAKIEVIAGTPAATPSAPALPAMAVELARLTIPASGGAAASVNNSYRTFAAAIGGELIVATQARLPASAPTWQAARALDTGVTYLWDGTAWTSGGSGWVTYTPTWETSSGAAAEVGNGSLTGAWVRDDQDNVDFWIKLTFGSTSVMGGGARWDFGMPAPEATRYADYDPIIGRATIRDISASDRYSRGLFRFGAQRFYLGTADGIVAPMGKTTPVTFATGDIIAISGRYQAAPL